MIDTPHDWHSGVFEDFIVLQRGFDLTKDSAHEGNIPVVSSSGISYYHDTAMVEPPGVVTGRKGSLGKVFFIDVPFWPHDTTLWVKDFKGNHPKFVKIFLESLDLAKFDAATSVPTLNRNNIHKLRVSFPSLAEQYKIANILSVWDEAISNTERLITTLQDRKIGLMQSLLFGHVRFARFQKSKSKQETKYGEIPIEWEYISIESIAHQISTKNEKGDDLPVLSCTKYDGLVDSLTYFGRQIFSEDTSTYRVVKRGQFAYATNHIEEGSIGYQNLYDRALISPMYTVFETNERIDDGFLYKLLKTELYRHVFETNTSASIDRRGSLRWNMFSQIKIPLPSLKEQKAIAEVIDTCQLEINLTKKKLEALQQQKKGLMQKLLTGQTRVKV